MFDSLMAMFMQNNTSWVLHNMAAFYWRIKGEAGQAIECLRRALHYSTRSASLTLQWYCV